MGDAGDYWRDIKEYRKEVRDKRESKMPNPKTLLNKIGAAFEVKNSGHHYIINFGGCMVDYWPSTGYWKFRKTSETGYNISPLISRLKQMKGESI